MFLIFKTDAICAADVTDSISFSTIVIIVIMIVVVPHCAKFSNVGFFF